MLSLASCFSYALTLSKLLTLTAAAVLNARAIPLTRMSICGYLIGDPLKSYIALKGYNYRVDTSHRL